MCPQASNQARASGGRLRRCAAPLALVWSAALLAAPLAAAQAREPALAELPLAPGSNADRIVEQFLQEHGLTTLLAEQLSHRLAASVDESRARVAEKLARVYALLLESPLDAEQRQRIEAQSQALLSRLPNADAADLRLTLLRSAYAQAEGAAERWLLRLVDERERDNAAGLLAEQGRSFEAIANDADDRIRTLEEQEGSLDGALARRIAQRLAEERSRRSLARYLAAWAHTYHAMLTGSRESATRGASSASRVLGAETAAKATPIELSDRLLRYEHVARSAVAAALCAAVLGDAGAAMDWLDAIEQSESAPDSVKRELPARRGLALTLLGRWSAARELAAEAPELSQTAMRLLAAQALAAVARGETAAQRTAEAALARLVREASVSHVLDLATQFGVASLPERGFVALYVRGVSAHREAAALEERAPPRARALHKQAAELIERALEASDAPRFAAAEHDAAMIAGASLLRAAQVGSERALAAAWFERAAQATDDRARKGEALWGAITALAGSVRDEKRRALLERFLREFSDHPRFAAVALERAQLTGVDPVEAAADLLRVDAGDPLARAARARAASLLFDAMRASTGAEQAALAEQYLQAATPLLMRDAVDAEAGDAAAAPRAAARARRALEAAFAVEPPMLEHAERALQVVDALAEQGVVDLAPARDELDERRVRLLAARGGLDEALALIEQMRARARSDGANDDALLWARSAAAATAQRAINAWRDARNAGDDDAMRAAASRLLRVVELGLRADEDSAAQAYADALAPDVAEAALYLWRLTQDEAALRAAERANDAVLSASPRDRAALRRKALLAQAQGDDAAALEAWRTLAAGLAPASRAWFEARAGVIEALAAINPERARTALAQHAAMHPDLGPEPWRSRLREIALELGVAPLTPEESGG